MTKMCTDSIFLADENIKSAENVVLTALNVIIDFVSFTCMFFLVHAEWITRINESKTTSSQNSFLIHSDHL